MKREVSYNRICHCPDCSGSGAAKGTHAETCSKCRGTGRMRVVQRLGGMQFQSEATCDACRGSGKIIKTPCSNCRGTGLIRINKKLEVSVPAGIDDGERIALRGQGNDGKNGGGAGDLIIQVMVKPHPIFERDNTNDSTIIIKMTINAPPTPTTKAVSPLVSIAKKFIIFF